MKFLVVVFVALELLTQVIPATGGGTSCGRKFPGHCRINCKADERSLFICGRNQHCCVYDLLKPDIIMSKQFLRYIRKNLHKAQRALQTPPQPLLSSTEIPTGTSIRTTEPTPKIVK